MASFIRESKFRNIEVKVDAREKFYEQLRVANGQSDCNNALTANSNFLAYIDSSGGSSCVGVLPLSSVGKNHVPISAPAYQQPIIRAHSQAVQDIAFDSFNKQRIFSCSTDGLVKLWDIPTNGFVVDCTNAMASFTNSRSCPVRGLAPHPTVQGLLAARGSRDAFLFDVEAQKEIHCTAPSLFTADLHFASWSFSGHVLMTTSKDKNLRLFDLRSSNQAISTVQCHGGLRPVRPAWLGNSNTILTVGHSASLDREYCLWDERNLVTPIKKERIDGSTSPIVPVFDPDTSILALVGKGDSSIRFYEIFNGSEIAPISNSPCGDVIRGVTLLPKQANNLMNCEVLRILKLTDNAVQPISVTVPRKEKKKFHDDLYPPSYWEAPSSLSLAGWSAGENATPAQVAIASPLSVSTPTKDSSESESQSVDSSTPIAAAVEETPASPSPSSASNRVSMRFQTNNLKYRHMYGKENPKAETFYNLLPNLSANDNNLIACSDEFWAVPYQGGGGPVYVSSLRRYGKVEPSCAVVNGHKSAVQEISFSPFQSNIMATASSDCTVKVWRLPSDIHNGGLKESLSASDAIATLNSHVHIVRTCNFHPVVDNLLCTTSQDMTVRLHDIEKSEEVSRVNLNLNDGSQVSNLSFNFDGTLFSLACKDRTIRIVDPRSRAIVLSTAANSVVGRNLRAVWCSNGASKNTVLSTSSSNTGMRQIHLWDVRNMTSLLASKVVDNAAGQLMPMYDEDTNVCFVAGKGDTIVRYYELNFLNELNVECEKSNEFQTSREPIAGMCLLPKRVCDVRNIEANRLLKLTSESVIPISFFVPRADHLKDFFHDDIFPPSRSKTSTVSIQQWVDSGVDGPLNAPHFESLRPETMAVVSEKSAEPVSKSKVALFRENIDKAEAANKEREDTFSRLQNLAIQRSKYHPNASGGAGGHGFKVDAAPVVDDNGSDDGWDD